MTVIFIQLFLVVVFQIIIYHNISDRIVVMASALGAVGHRIPTVLVLCQRSRGLVDESTRVFVQDTIVPAILDFVEERYGREFRIRFLAPCNESMGEYTDYNVTLDAKNVEKVEERMKGERIDSFDFVILHTCPTILMDFEAIWRVMSLDGIMVMTKYDSCNRRVKELDTIHKYRGLHKDTADEIVARVDKYFDEIEGRDGYYIRKTVPHSVVSRKRSRGGGGGGGGKKGRKNTLRYKPKRSRRGNWTKRSGSNK